MEQLLHTTIKNLHTLHLYPITGDEQRYEALLQHSIEGILRLFSYDDKYYNEVHLTVLPNDADIGSLSFLFYVDKHVHSNSGSINDSNILHYVQSNIETIEVDNHLMKELLKILSRHNKDDTKKPVRLKDSYLLIVYKFSQVVEFFNKFRIKSEDALATYLHRCFAYEGKFSSTLRNQIGYEETEKIVDILDSFISKTEQNVVNDSEDNDSMFSYEDKTNWVNIHPSSPLGFRSTDPDFEKLYQIFLQISAFKSDQTSTVDFSRYVRLMISFYKKHNNTQSLELDSFKFKELKLNFFYNFLVGDSTETPLLPIYFRDATKRVLANLNLFPEMSKLNNKRDEIPYSLPSSASDKEPATYSKEDQIRLVSGLKRIIPLLNEFNLNFNPDFPILFQYYLNFVYGDFDESTEQADFQYIDSIVKSVNIITEFENEDESVEDHNLKGVVNDFYKDHQRLVEESLDSTLLMKLAITEFDADTDIKRSILTQWNFKTLKVSQLEYNMVNKFSPMSEDHIKTRILTHWFTKLQRFKKLQMVSEKYHDKHLTVKVLKDYWIPALITLGKCYESAQHLYLIKLFRRWRSYAEQVKGLQEIADDRFKRNNMDGVLQIWTNSYNKALDLRNIADEYRKEVTDSRSAILRREIWKLWFHKLNEVPNLSEKLVLLSQTERRVVTKKFFSAWSKEVLHKQIFKEVKKRNSYLLKSYFFKSKWLNKLQVNKKLKELVQSKHQMVLDKTFQHWKGLQSLRSLADIHYNRTVNYKIFTQWMLEIRLSVSWNDSQKSVIKNSQVKLFFHQWKLALRLKVYDKERKASLLRRGFEKWVNNNKRLTEYCSRAADFEKDIVQQNQLTRWNQALEQNQLLAKSSDLYRLKKYFDIMLNSYKKYTIEYGEQALKFSKSPLSTKITIASVFKKWQEEYHQRFEILALEKVKYFVDNVSIPDRKYTFLSIWVKRYNEEYSRNVALDEICDEFIARSNNKGNYFHMWAERTRETIRLRQQSETFEANLLSKKFILIWYDQYVNKGMHLNDLADDNISQKDLLAARNILSKWSMKYIKTIKRNHQTCEMFTERWEMSRARAILDLWIQKTQEKLANDDSFELSDTSLVSNLSPLANKSVRSAPITTTRFEGNSSYLYTPIKLQVRSPTTPHGRNAGPSPSKLQETNMKLKLERIESLRRHFGRAKGQTAPRGQSTPFKAEAVHLTMPEKKQPIRLSPPKSRTTRMPLPPKAPDFRASRSLSPEAELSQTEMYSKAAAITSEEEEIESAKRLRKITPIYFPQDDAEPRLSPLHKIREKHQDSSGVFS